MRISRIFAMLLSAFTAAAAYASEPYDTDGAGLNGYEVPQSTVYSDLVDITRMSLSKDLDLSDNADCDDGAAIEEAINKLKAGQALYLPEGVYNTGRVINLKSGKGIIGDDQSKTVLKVKDGATGAVIKGDSIKDCVVENLTVTSDWDGRYSLSTVYQNPDAGQLKFGVLLYSPERTTVRNLNIEKFNIAGIAVCSGNDCRIRNNRISNATDLSGEGHGYGILLQDRNGNDKGVERSIIEGNELYGPYLRHGVLLQAFSNHNEIKENRFDATRLDSIDLHGEGEHHNEIMWNKISGGGESGVGVGNGPAGTHGAGGDYNYIHDNEIDQCAYGITVMMGTQNTIIAENTVSAVTTTGVRMRCSGSTVIYGNTFFDMPSALLFQKESEDMGSSTHTVFENNTMNGVETACMVEKNAAENEMFASISGNSGNEDKFLSITPADDSALTMAAGYSGSALADIGIGTGENAVLSDKAYSEISYFQWEPETLRPKCDKIVLYNITN